MGDATLQKISVIPAVSRADGSAWVIFRVGDDDMLMAADQARRLADILRAVAADADAHAVAQRTPEAKAFDAAHGQHLGRA